MKSKAINVRRLPDEIYTALRKMAANKGLSAEAAVREILTATIKPAKRICLADEIYKIGRQLELTEEDCEFIANVRQQI